jgi:hypothetical protein
VNALAEDQTLMLAPRLTVVFGDNYPDTGGRSTALARGVHQIHCKDYRDGARHKTLRLDGAEFVRRFLLHVLPQGLMRIRHFGFLANRCRHAKLARIRQALAAATAEVIVTHRGAAPSYPCPQCQQG